MKPKISLLLLRVVIAGLFVYSAGCAGSTGVQNKNSSNLSSKLVKYQYSGVNLDTVKAGKYDTGKMWTFDYPPLNYFKSEYNFEPTKEWLDNARLSALRFANYCSASFVSADGLVMTNQHCGRQSVVKVTKEGEDLLDNGFYAKTLSDERQVPGLYVDQLVLIKDVTREVHAAIDSAITDQGKLDEENDVIQRIKNREEKETSLRIQVVTFYNGGKYSVYGYKRYNDVRLVFSPEASMGYFGGDPDNFTYPRYDLDCNFFRVYNDDGKPLKTDHYFKWSAKGVEIEEPIFVIGNPGSTDRLKTVSQLEFMRDHKYPRSLDVLNALINTYSYLLGLLPDKNGKLQNLLYDIKNQQKEYVGVLNGLRNPVLMQRKIDFEKKFKNAIRANSKLNSEYGDLWAKIAKERNELGNIEDPFAVMSMVRYPGTLTPEYFLIAQQVIELANQLKLPEDQRSDEYKGAELDNTINYIIQTDFNKEEDRYILDNLIPIMIKYSGADNPVIIKIIGRKSGKSAEDYMMSHTVFNDTVRLKAMIDKGPDAILNSDDPFIYYLVNTEKQYENYAIKMDDIYSEDDIYSHKLGIALFKIYGTSIPPDATFTLRISDGVIKGYPYNGTEAPPFTTFYGLYDRYYSFSKKDPWDLPKEWLNPPGDFNLQTPMDFVSTADIIGGNSGSAIINEKSEIVGLAFDGNIESLPGDFILTTKTNRCVGVASQGMMEAIKHIYKATRLSDELQAGYLVNVDTVSSNGAK
jgi:Peptidase S46